MGWFDNLPGGSDQKKAPPSGSPGSAEWEEARNEAERNGINPFFDPYGFQDILEGITRRNADRAKLEANEEFFMNQSGYRKSKGPYGWEEIPNEELINYVGKEQAQQITENRQIDRLFRERISLGLQGKISDPGFEKRAKDLEKKLDIELFQRGQGVDSTIGRDKNLDLFNTIERTRAQIGRGNVSGYAGEQRLRDYGQEQSIQNMLFNVGNQNLALSNLDLQRQQLAQNARLAREASRSSSQGNSSSFGEELFGTIAGAAIPGLINYLMPVGGGAAASGGAAATASTAPIMV